MENAKIKEILLDIHPTELDFSVIQTGKESHRVNGLYAPDTHEILLHNKNFKTENQLIYTAVHEYTHHLNAEDLIKTTGNPSAPYNSKVHNQAFWARFYKLISIAEEKNYYKLSIDASPELIELTEKIKKEYVEKNGLLMQEFGKLLIKAHELCEKADIRYEDYIDRVLRLPRTAATSITKVAKTQVNPALGFENMKLVANIAGTEEKQRAEEQLLAGHSPDSVRAMMKKKAQEVDLKSKLEKEKQRLEKTIQQLTSRLEYVEESLANM